MFTCGCRFDEDHPDGDESGHDDALPAGPLGVDGNGAPTERVFVAGQEVIVHHDDVPESDITTVNGIPCTTALRTVIDVAPEVEPAHLEQILEDCLRRGLFTIDEARERLGQPDMADRPGAVLVRRALML